MYRDYYYDSADGLRLYARDYPCIGLSGDSAPILLCMHGLSRNSKDFAGLADMLSHHYRVISVDQRGRGRSAYDSNPDNYQPAMYCQDMFTLLDSLGIDEVSAIGTSMGGLMSFIMTTLAPERIKSLVINDIGPEVDPVGLARIQGYVGKLAPPESWQEAVAQVQSINGPAFPDFSDAEWMSFTRNLYVESTEGKPQLDYDANISKPMDVSQSAAVPPDLWQFFDATLTKPMLLVHGALSDILADACVAKMQERHPAMQYLRLENRGHAPTLDEPESRLAIANFLEDVYND
ncbi:MAG: alpha/beta hydrolase [Halieaceae bacterium]|nr:alpha/beta hydrolase [Halieaceae bacterium]